MKRISVYITNMVLGIVLLTSCHKQLDREPPNTLPSEKVYTTETGYLQVLAKVYGSMALTGNQGPAGSGDVAGIDEGTSDFLRLFWKAQELSTDEAVVAWNDPGIQDFHNMNWSADNQFLKPIYYRSFYQITLVNNFLNQSTDEKLAANGITNASDIADIKLYRQEARYIRAFQYAILMDMFGNPAFVDENNISNVNFE